MRRILFSAMTVGERPEVALHHRRDWFSHTYEFRRDHSSPAYVFELLRGALCHVSWRITRKSDASLLPFALLIAARMVLMLTTSSFENSGIEFNRSADLVEFVLLTGLALSFLKRPWDLHFRWSVTALMFLYGGAVLLTAFTLEPRTLANTASFVMLGAGIGLAAVSSLRTRFIMGASSTSMALTSAATAVGAFQLLSTVWIDGPTVLSGVKVIDATTYLGVAYMLWRVWHSGQRLPAVA